MEKNAILKTEKLASPWTTMDPFLFCVHHLDYYPKGNKQFGPDAPLLGRHIGNDFIIKDGWRMYHGETVPGFPSHPHRGFETVTYVLQGLIDHADSQKGAGRYGNGDVQWMTAGKGLQHSEMFPLLNQDKDNTSELFQIWLNLPAERKFVEPAYKMLWKDTIPKYTEKDKNGNLIDVDVVAGTIKDIAAPKPAPDSWAANPENEVAIWQINIKKNARWDIPLAKGNINRMLYFFEGESIQLNETKITPNYSAQLDATKKVTLQNGNKNSRLLLLQGKPINEPVAHYGPFVMNTQDEIQQAFADYQETRFGGWPWSRNDVVHGPDKIRFARFSSGEEVIKA